MTGEDLGIIADKNRRHTRCANSGTALATNCNILSRHAGCDQAITAHKTNSASKKPSSVKNIIV